MHPQKSFSIVENLCPWWHGHSQYLTLSEDNKQYFCHPLEALDYDNQKKGDLWVQQDGATFDTAQKTKILLSTKFSAASYLVLVMIDTGPQDRVTAHY